MEPDYSALESAYKAATIGKRTPAILGCNGRMLNEKLKTNAYDPRAMYLVTKHGIQKIEAETMDWL